MLTESGNTLATDRQYDTIANAIANYLGEFVDPMRIIYIRNYIYITQYYEDNKPHRVACVEVNTITRFQCHSKFSLIYTEDIYNLYEIHCPESFDKLMCDVIRWIEKTATPTKLY